MNRRICVEFLCFVFAVTFAATAWAQDDQAAAKETAATDQQGEESDSPAAWPKSVRLPAGEKLQTLFNGKDLQGWDGDPKFWRVVDGTIVGENKQGVKVPTSTYLFSKKEYRNFRLLFEVKQTVGEGYSKMHSAVCALGKRGVEKGPSQKWGFTGPLLMVCHDWGIWDAYGRNRVFPPKHKGTYVPKVEKKGQWNQVEMLVVGNRIRVYANGQKVMDFTDQPERLRKSPIGLQLHANQRPQKYLFRGVSIVENPVDEIATKKAD